MTKRQRWFALDVHVFDSDTGVGLREEFGTAGLCMWVGFLAACKRSNVPGQITYSSDAECLAQMGLPGLELVDEEGEPFTLEDFWTYLGHHKQTARTARRRLQHVRATRFEQWQQTVGRAREAERKSRSRAQNSRTNSGHVPDKNRTDIDSDKDRDIDRDTSQNPPLEIVGTRDERAAGGS